MVLFQGMGIGPDQQPAPIGNMSGASPYLLSIDDVFIPLENGMAHHISHV